MKFIGYTATFLAVVFFNATISGWAFSILWEWFIAGTFGLPSLSIPLAIGLTLTVSFIFPTGHDDEDNKSFGEVLALSVVKVVTKALVCLLCGLAILQFV